MQDIHSVRGGGRFFGGSGGGDRRLRPHQHPNQQALKCPRCDSLHTKFCYYNNYNLSQPRHFCKACRRYWTKGGVLRNVPVGGGCRKTKRSQPKNSSSSSPTSSPPPPPPQPNSADQNKSSSHSSSESSSLTNPAAAAAATAATEAVSDPSSTGSASNLLTNIHNPESKFFVSQGGANGGFEPGASAAALLEQITEINGLFSEIGSFTSLITSSNDVPFSFGNIDGSPFDQQGQVGNHHHNQVHQNQWAQQNQEGKMQEISGGLLDQTAQVDLSVFQNRSNGVGGGEFGPLDWQPGSVDQGLFDLPNTVDQQYWSQSQWADQDHPTLYLPFGQCAGTGATRLGERGPTWIGKMSDYDSTWRRDGEEGEPWMITKEDTWAYVMCQGPVCPGSLAYSVVEWYSHTVTDSDN